MTTATTVLTEPELEAGTSTSISWTTDPLSLRNNKKTDADIRQIKDNGGSKKVQKFYQNQNEQIDEILAPLQPPEDELAKQRLKIKIAVYGSFAANILLFALQLVGAIMSGSLSIVATCADAFMDLMSSAILFWAHRQMAKPNLLEYPAGKARMETAAIIVFSCLMSCVAIFLIIESATKLTSGDHSAELGGAAIAFVSVAIGTKFALFLYCFSLRKDSSAKVLAQDHRNDILVNALGLTTGILGTKVEAWVDPVGCILIALIILVSWASTCIENVRLIVGQSADTAFLQRATYIALTHPGIDAVDTCRAYHAGNNLFVEVDIVLSEDTPLRKSHDIGEALQEKLESLPKVERAFVHVDYESTHQPEHSRTK